MNAKPILLLSALAAASVASATDYYSQLNLVGDTAGAAVHTDPNLVNAWGLSSSPTGPWWISDNGTGLATVYNGDGVVNSLVVNVPAWDAPTGGPVSGQVYNANHSAFKLNSNANTGASFLFATEDGTISGWNFGVDSGNSHVLLNNWDAGDRYKGLAIDGSTSSLYVPNFAAATASDQIKVYNGSLGLVRSFGDATVDAGYKPFNAAVMGGKLYVSYALRGSTGDDIGGAGHGFVDAFSLDGSSMTRLVSHGDLDSPWGMALAPSNFGTFSGDLLVGNFGDGKIHAFDTLTGAEKGTLSDANGNPLVIDGLWGLAFGNGTGSGATNSLYFTAGPNGENNGLFGRVNAVPEPVSTTIMLGYGCFLAIRRRSKNH